jgi:adenylate cyclase
LDEQRVIRRLAAILAADVAGYSRLTGADEEGTLARLRALAKELLDPTIAAHRGRVVKRTGDGILIEFASVVDAVRCALAVQAAMAGRNRAEPSERRIEFRVGIHLGDIVLEEDGDLMGDGVNIAARLEGIAPHGGICVSAAAYDQIKGKLTLPVRDIGEQRLKNIADPVHVFRIEFDETGQPRSGRRSHRRESRVVAIVAALAIVLVMTGWAGWVLRGGAKVAAAGFSLVVLPFANLSGDSAQDYLADVLTDELTTYLSRIPGSFVIARNTAFTFKGKSVDVKQVAKDLGVRYVLEGSVQPSGSRVRTNAQLIDADSGAHLWADQFDKDRADLLQMQDEIVTRIARALQIELAAVQAARLKNVPPTDLGADDLAMQCEAIFLRYSGGREEVKAAFPLCAKAIQIDPRNVRALSVSARLRASRAIQTQTEDRPRELQNADELALRALAIDPNSSLAHQAKALVLMMRKNGAEAVVEAELGVALNPSDIGAYSALCGSLNASRHPERAIEAAEKAIRLSPRDPFLFQFHAQIALAYFELQRYDRTVEWGQRALAENPYFSGFLVTLAAAYSLNGQEAEAHETLARYLTFPLSGKTIRQLKVQPNIFDADTAERHWEGLRKAGIPEE